MPVVQNQNQQQRSHSSTSYTDQQPPQTVSMAALATQMKACLQEPFPEAGAPQNTYVFGEDDFKVKMGVYLSFCDQQQVAHQLDDYPEDTATQMQLVQSLVEAMTNVEDAVDKDSKVPVNRVKKLSPMEFNLMAWAVLLQTRDIQRGVVSMPRWGRDWDFEECQSFSQRYELVRSALAKRKSVVSSLFDHVFIKRLTLNPSQEGKRKDDNKVNNDNRRKNLAIVRKKMGDQSG